MVPAPQIPILFWSAFACFGEGHPPKSAMKSFPSLFVSGAASGTPKSGKARDLPLTPLATAALQAHPRRGVWVFSQEDGSMLSKGQCKWPLFRARDRAGLEHLGWHEMRHTFASNLVMRGGPLKAVQEPLGAQAASSCAATARRARSVFRAWASAAASVPACYASTSASTSWAGPARPHRRHLEALPGPSTYRVGNVGNTPHSRKSAQTHPWSDAEFASLVTDLKCVSPDTDCLATW